MGNDKVSASAWNAALEEINQRFSKLEKKINDIEERLSKKVNEIAWNKTNEEIIKKIKSKVSAAAWEKSLEDMNKQFTEFALNQLKILDSRVDKLSSLLNETMSRLNEKFDSLESENKEIKVKVIGIEKLIEDARVSERQLKKLLESI